MKRIDGKPPFGGDYAEFHFLDAENNEVDEGKETSIVICECKADVTLVKESYGRYLVERHAGRCGRMAF